MIVLPRLHRELTTLPAGVELPQDAQFLWPGLPGKPASGFASFVYPWSPAQAAACVADFENLARDGAKGRPVQALVQAQVGQDLLGYGAAGHDLSAEERRALLTWQQGQQGQLPEDKCAHADKNNPESVEHERQTAAQSVLLLAWLREKQNLELRELEDKVKAGRGRLADFLGEALPRGLDEVEKERVPDSAGNAAEFVAEFPVDPGSALPAWRDVLEAALPFLPEASRIIVVDQAMADAVAALAATEAVPALPEGSHKGWREISLPPEQLLGRAGHSTARRFLIPTR